jgi:hypothetical protein
MSNKDFQQGPARRTYHEVVAAMAAEREAGAVGSATAR